jgi:alkylated DNA repair protein alkB homolog 7
MVSPCLLNLEPHVDSVKFSGGIVAGLSLLSARIVRLTLAPPEEISDATPGPGSRYVDGFTNKESLEELLPQVIEFVAAPRSLYVLSGVCRYRYSHAVLAVNSTELLTAEFPVERRMSLITRDELIVES